MFVACVAEVNGLTAFVVLNASDHVSNMDVLNNQVLYRWLRGLWHHSTVCFVCFSHGIVLSVLQLPSEIICACE